MKEATSERKKRSDNRKPRVRLIPIWLRLIIITCLLLLSLIIGAMIGYGVIGEGRALDVLKKETWQHIVDLVVKE